MSPPTITLDALAERFALTVAGDGATVVAGVCTLAPGEPGRLAFLASAKHRGALAETRAAAVIVPAREASRLVTPGLVAPDPTLAFARIAALFDPDARFEPGVHPSATVDRAATLGAGCEVGPQAVIEAGAALGAGCRIGPGAVIGAGAALGDGTRVEARAVIGARVRLGARVRVLPGAVVGSRGFGNARTPDGGWEPIPQLGTVVVGDDVEIGANTCIDRGALGDTVIEAGVKLDNLIQIAHNVRIGAHTAIAAGTGIAGSTVVGKRCMIGGAVGMNGHIRIADDVVILGRAMVTHSLEEKDIYGSGLPVAPAREWRRTVARIHRLDRLQARVKHLEQLLRVEGGTDGDTEADGEADVGTVADGAASRGD